MNEIGASENNLALMMGENGGEDKGVVQRMFQQVLHWGISIIKN